MLHCSGFLVLVWNFTLTQLKNVSKLFKARSIVTQVPQKFDVKKCEKIIHNLRDENKELYSFFLEAISDGVSIGRDDSIPTPSQSNLKTTVEDKILITKLFLELLDKGCMIGPFGKDQIPIHGLHVSPAGCVEKPPLFPGGDRRIRPIVHMSAPRTGISVNSGICEENKNVKYTSFRELCQLVLNAGKGGWLWCVDAQDAYLWVPVKKKDWKWQGVRWLGKYLVITTLFFGLASAPKIYTKFADVILWAIVHHNEKLFFEESKKLIEHYLDDFFGGSKSEEKSTRQFESVLEMFDALGVPTRKDKCRPPAKKTNYFRIFI